MKPTFIFSRLAAAVLAAVLAGCSMAPTYQRPEAPVPTTWNAPSAGGAPSAAATLDWQSLV
ncbi:multidrug transporter, partial [Salmonella enterica]|nr:multidrug transporter [Salmonella enterica]